MKNVPFVHPLYSTKGLGLVLGFNHSGDMGWWGVVGEYTDRDSEILLGSA